ncbi:hypothetical protein DOT_3357 [Desulfosporosinus sp. OT]|nr:hypothetical protein DOT_3357 [Desulfosporosinus sp. OT]
MSTLDFSGTTRDLKYTKGSLSLFKLQYKRFPNVLNIFFIDKSFFYLHKRDR